MSRRRPWLISLFLAFLSIALFLTLDFLDPLFMEALEAKTLDLRFRLRGARDPGRELVIVAIDEKSLQALGRWPWSRRTMAELVDRLSAGRPRAIGLDLIFSEREGPHADFALAAAVKRAGNVVLAFVPEVPTAYQGTSVFPREIPFSFYDSAYTIVKQVGRAEVFRPIEASGALLPLDELIGAARTLGHVYSLSDRDGTIRWEVLSVKYGEEYYPSFALQLARIALGLSPEEVRLLMASGVEVGGTRRIVTDQYGRMLLNYAGREGTFPYVSAVDVLQGRVQPAVFTDRIVLVGTSAVGTYDQKVVPFSANMPGIEKHATAIENIFHETFLLKTPALRITDKLMIILLGLAPGLFLHRMRAVTGFLLSLTFLFGYGAAVQAAFITEGWWMNLLLPSAALILTYTAITAVRFGMEERQAREVRRIFSTYVTPRVVEELVRDPGKAKLGGVRREVTILFTDVKNFTAFSERHDPEVVVGILNEYLGAMTDVIFKWDGTVDKFIGDAILAFWGAPLPQDDHAVRAVRCALEMRQRLLALQAQWRAEGRVALDAGIGLDTGEVVVGNIGAQGKKMDYTVIGDHVNLASRVEALTRQYDAPILLTEYTYRHVKDTMVMEELATVKVKGREEPVVLYTPAELRDKG
ncbi:MAG: adenylate/guanylate cyclase domain-containing protein [Nitrospirota bacterium]